jgi:phytoene dehydrogenase-like protein
VPDFRAHVIDVDVFTPRTIKKFTGHLNGAVYGAPVKILEGTTPVRNLYLCGTDQGFLGIIGSMLSGITMANNHLLPRS